MYVVNKDTAAQCPEDLWAQDGPHCTKRLWLKGMSKSFKVDTEIHETQYIP